MPPSLVPGVTEAHYLPLLGTTPIESFSTQDLLDLLFYFMFARSLFAETDDTIITEEVRKFPSRK
jgi:hypothetical protein